MEHVSFAEYQAAKAEIIGGVEYKENTKMADNTILKTYTTEKNGTFYEINTAGVVEFWSNKHQIRRIYDDRPAKKTTQAPQPEETKGYGERLAEKIRATANTGNLPQFEKFVLDRGWEFPTEEGLKAAYDRLWKSCHGILLSKEEFMAEANRRGTKEHSEELYAGMLYDAIAELAKEKKLDPCKVYQYARFRWCFNQPDAVVAYQTDRERWSVNNCDTEITTERAVVEVNQEWGFEASRVKILDNPYYESTDWNWIRFDCAGMSWLMCNGSLYQVYH